ncbi:MAG TPA: hypothetical protein VFE47_23230 [Tepidisphaeraceae bacterium]|jgi:hypothetical protein|nr:hypothetical protein [Tepidisphaeraceae bacterium]
MKKRDFRIGRVNNVVREHRTALVAIEILDRQLKLNPSLMASHDLSPSDFVRFRDNLEGTYFIRVFAEFESAFRDVWNSTGRGTEPRTADLLDALTSRRTISSLVLQNAHRVRKYRNGLVHQDSADAEAISFAEAARDLLRFLAYMPANW